MRVIAESGFVEYARWYLQRAQHFGTIPPFPIPETPALLDELFQSDLYQLKGKWMPWFKDEAHWKIVELSAEEFQELRIVDSAETRGFGLVVWHRERTLVNAARLAVASGYFQGPAVSLGHAKHLWYYQNPEQFLPLAGIHRLVVRTADEVGWPEGTYYLQDGLGRGLAYLARHLEGTCSLEPIEAFLAIAMDTGACDP